MRGQAVRGVTVLVATAGACAIVAVVGGIIGWPVQVVVGLLAGAVIATGLALMGWAKWNLPAESDEQPRTQKGPDRHRRRLFLRLGIGAGAATATALAIPAARRVEVATNELRRTAWRDGVAVVDASGDPIVLDDIPVGEMATVYPAGAVGRTDSQAVLIREAPARFSSLGAHADFVTDGVAVFSKLCTHMACPLGLYQQQSGTLLCPCHQAAFDVLDGGRAVAGPARRALPRLPIRVDGTELIATGDFSEPVGAGFWWRR